MINPMKKMFFIALVAMCTVFNACADNDRIITFAQIPATAQATVQQYFDVSTIAYVKLDDELLGDKYEVRFNDGKEIDFESDGSLRKVDFKYAAVPDALVPEVVRQQVAASFPQAFIVEWGKDDRGWKAELNNKLELNFNRKLEMVGIDD
jgi:hypothetical protein